jgi:hypothetical protein
VNGAWPLVHLVFESGGSERMSRPKNSSCTVALKLATLGIVGRLPRWAEVEHDAIRVGS